MKKNFKIIFQISFIVIFSVKLEAKNLCQNFYNYLNDVEFNSEMFLLPSSEYETFGFDLRQKWDPNFINEDDEGEIKGSFVTKLNEEGYPFVGHIQTEHAAKQIKFEDQLLKINGEDVRNFDILNAKATPSEIFKDILKDKDNKFLLKDRRGNVYDYISDKKILTPIEFYYDIYFKYLKINDKTGTFDVTMNLEFTGELGPDFELYKVARKFLTRDKEYYECDFSAQDWRKLDIVRPDYGIVFPDLVQSDKSLQNEYYLVEPLLFIDDNEEIDEEGSFLKIDYLFEGTKRFRSDIDLKTFPFDKQILKIFIKQNRYEIDQSHTVTSNFTQRRLSSFAEQENPIQGWNIVSYDFSYKPTYDKNMSTWNDGVQITLEVERKSSYYVFKIILPIILILMVCWSAIYITPREIESRLTITIVCLLSLIAYNFVIDSDLPKLEYLTVMDYIILLSYFYAAIPNFLSIYSHNKLISKNKKKFRDIEEMGKKYGLISYIAIILFIIILNTNLSPENTSGAISWMSLR